MVVAVAMVTRKGDVYVRRFCARKNVMEGFLLTCFFVLIFFLSQQIPIASYKHFEDLTFRLMFPNVI